MDSLNYEYPLERDPIFLTGGFHPSFGDPTWKERHANGVPAVASTPDQCREWRALTDHSKRRETNLWHVCPYEHDRQNPELSVSIPMVWAGEFDEFNDWVIVAQFCNFRYKPEWLERPDKHCAKGNCIGDGSCYHCGCAYRR